MKDFYTKLHRYVEKVNKNKIENPEPFEYITTSIDYEVAKSINDLYMYVSNLEESYDKECDYNRLLRQENRFLTDELDYMYDNQEPENIVIEYNNKELPSWRMIK